METDEERLKRIYENWKTEDLLRAATVNRLNYESLALDMINLELQKRKVTNADKENFQNYILEKEERLLATGTPFCPNCHSTNLKEKFTLGRLLWGKLLG